jgi:uncharacterized protein
MELRPLIDALSRPLAYPFPVENVEVHQTHLSVVFLAGPFAYKVKKPVHLGFLEINTLEDRRHYCDLEVQLNRRLAGDIYHGVVPIAQTADGLRVEAEGAVVEWAVKMDRLPADATLESRLNRQEVDAATVAKLGQTVAAFHAGAATNDHIASFARFAVVAENGRENFRQTEQHIGQTVTPRVCERLRALTEKALEELAPVIDRRAGRGIPRDTHGDLHLDHVYYFPDRPPPKDLVIIDCVEFNERFRYADPVADMAFLYMDLLFHGRRDLADAFAESYFHSSRDEQGRSLLPFYAAYRALVRAKVEGMALADPVFPDEERATVLQKARAHWLLALRQLEEPLRKPCLVLVGGLPGSGKSTLACGLAEKGGFQVIRSDVVRKDFHTTPNDRLYTNEWNDRTYAECACRAEAVLFEGGRVLIDATFREERRRLQFLDLARQWGVPVVFFVSEVGPSVARQRLDARRSDVSDADWSVYLRMAEAWESPGERTKRALRRIDATANPNEVLRSATVHLRELGLANDRPFMH